ncbi:hypothetical protein NM208_g5582 [Fusarium decemcellulare]|uniref:Uncharacterized protein n=1 Tax=Fusarium decemcellulare TaxID=57161 RepID=A0ACC1SGP9_9HYPO|nr:hypothetical protein NM208_g5582 [Fusarium decemcellulare]
MTQTQDHNPPNAPTTKLSPEILHLIFGYFCAHCRGEYEWPFGVQQAAQDTLTLFNACLVSKYFRDIAQEILHHSFDPDCPRWLTPNPWEHRLEPFLRTVASRPDLARSVKAAFLRVPLVEALSFDEGRDVFDTCARSLGTSAYEIYQKEHLHLASDAAAIERAFFLREPAPENMEQKDFIPVVARELLTILASLLPSLAHLGIEEDDSIRKRFQFDISPATLKALEITTLPLKTFESDRGLGGLLSRSPELETLVTLVAPGSWPLPNMPSLKNLHLRSKRAISRWAIERCLSICTGNLSVFSYTAVDSDVATVVKYLEQARFHATLELLHLDLRPKPSAWNVKMIPSLKLFTNLKTLFIPANSLYGTSSKPSSYQSLVDILPPNIVTLTLLENSVPTPPHRMRDDLQSLVNAKPTLFLQLKEIRSNSQNICDERLTSTFKQVDVALIFQQLPTSSWSCTGQLLLESPLNSPATVPLILPSELSDEDL